MLFSSKLQLLFIVGLMLTHADFLFAQKLQLQNVLLLKEESAETKELKSKPIQAGSTTETMQVGDLQREYILYVPKKYKDEKHKSLILAFHGGGANNKSFIRFTGLNTKADAAGFLVAYPNGTGRFSSVRTFNGGICCGYARDQNIDDVAFVKKLIDKLVTEYKVDPKRVYATGMSNGGIISYRLADELSEKIAAIAPVAGTWGRGHVIPNSPVSVLHIHGTDDKFLRVEGGPGKRSISKTNFISVDTSLKAWIQANGCKSTAKTQKWKIKTEDGMTAMRYIYTGGKSGTVVEYIEIKGGGHTWPGHVSRVKFLGACTTDFDTNDVIWEFFKAHPKK